jgi:hypothetical protein
VRADRVTLHHARTNALDVAVELDGTTFVVKDVGLGHHPHTLADGRGRPSTDCEIALAEALAINQERTCD